MDARVQAAALKMRTSMPCRGAWALTFATALLVTHAAYADIYTYVDTKGRVTVSNIEPPEDARVTSVVRSRPPPPPRADASNEASGNATVAALTRRVAQLEDELDVARSDPALPPSPPVVYPVIVTAPPVVTTQAIVYNVAPSPPVADYGCASWWAGCGLSWAPPFVFVGSTPVARHSGRFDRRRDNGLNRSFMSRPPLFPPSLRATPP
jgi:hypothetical protein